MFKRREKTYHINPKFRAYGKARLDIAQRAESSADWDKLWKKPAYPFPFTWGEPWKQSIEYRVDDFAAEVGFFIDILGLPVNAFDSEYAMFTSPGGDFYLSVLPAVPGIPSTAPEAFRIQFMVANLMDTAFELERRGITFEQWPQACAEGSTLFIGYFRTPHGIPVDLWGVVDPDLNEGSELEPVSLSSNDVRGHEPAPSVDVEVTATAPINDPKAPDETGSDPDSEEFTDTDIEDEGDVEVVDEEVGQLKYEYIYEDAT